MTNLSRGIAMSEDRHTRQWNRRWVRRAGYASALMASFLCLATSALGLTGALRPEPTPSGSVIAAASELAASEAMDGDCPWHDRRPDRVEVSSTSSSRSAVTTRS
jgi:hypothetical protein